jgi:hypothetical protein
MAAYQFRDADPGKVFKPTYTGRHLMEKFEREPKYKKRCPKHWISEGYVEEVKADEWLCSTRD